MISVEEALDVLKLADEAGLVLQPTNDQDVGGMCCCCGDCCGLLRNLNRLPNPAEVAVSGFQAHLEEALCASCGACELRCQMHAVSEENGVYSVDYKRCIGCGLCVTTCTTGAMTMERRPEAPPIPKTVAHNALRMWRERGKLDMAGLLKMGFRSKFDRLKASRLS
jgi:Na+-translocating ferredoxin:NAD+ oxidoreductase subunit B